MLPARLVLPLKICLALEDSVTGVIVAKAARMRCIAVPDVAHRSDLRYGIADKVLILVGAATGGIYADDSTKQATARLRTHHRRCQAPWRSHGTAIPSGWLSFSGALSQFS